MTERQVLEPTPQHPITVEPSTQHVVVRINGDVVADTRRAVDLQESNYPVVHYIPLIDVVADVLTPTDTNTYCPYKGEASYYSVTTAAGTVEDAVWTYPHPYPAVAPIAGHVAFYADTADITVADD